LALEIDVEAKSDHVHAQIAGIFEIDELIEQFPEVLILCKVRNLTKVFVDYREVDRETSNTEKYLHLISLSKRYELYRVGGGVPISIAFVVPEAMISPDKFGEEVAEMLGLNFKATADMESVVEWLWTSS
jgi:hypothetical protein